jgi:hypothetical protein
MRLSSIVCMSLGNKTGSASSSWAISAFGTFSREANSRTRVRERYRNALSCPGEPSGVLVRRRILIGANCPVTHFHAPPIEQPGFLRPTTP